MQATGVVSWILPQPAIDGGQARTTVPQRSTKGVVGVKFSVTGHRARPALQGRNHKRGSNVLAQVPPHPTHPDDLHLACNVRPTYCAVHFYLGKANDNHGGRPTYSPVGPLCRSVWVAQCQGPCKTRRAHATREIYSDTSAWPLINVAEL